MTEPEGCQDVAATDVSPACKAATGFLACGMGMPLIGHGPQAMMLKDSERVLPHIYQSRAGEAEPLFIRPVEFWTRKIGQTSPYPCAINRICVTLRPSVPLTVHEESYFILESFDGANVPTGEILLYNASDTSAAGGVDILQSSFENGNVSKGMWNVAECTGQAHGAGGQCSSLKLTPACRIEAGTAISFCFNVTNPAVAQEGPAAMTIFSSDGNSYQELQYSTELLNIPYVSAKDQRPMYIRTPAFRTVRIEQSSPFPCDLNTIKVHFSANVRPHLSALA